MWKRSEWGIAKTKNPHTAKSIKIWTKNRKQNQQQYFHFQQFWLAHELVYTQHSLTPDTHISTFNTI